MTDHSKFIVGPATCDPMDEKAEVFLIEGASIFGRWLGQDQIWHACLWQDVGSGLAQGHQEDAPDLRPNNPAYVAPTPEDEAPKVLPDGIVDVYLTEAGQCPENDEATVAWLTISHSGLSHGDHQLAIRAGSERIMFGDDEYMPVRLSAPQLVPLDEGVRAKFRQLIDEYGMQRALYQQASNPSTASNFQHMRIAENAIDDLLSTLGTPAPTAAPVLDREKVEAVAEKALADAFDAGWRNPSELWKGAHAAARQFCDQIIALQVVAPTDETARVAELERQLGESAKKIKYLKSSLSEVGQMASRAAEGLPS